MSNGLDTTLYGSTRYKRCSVNGNPRYVLHTADGDWSTATDAAVNYEVPNLTRDREAGLSIPVTITANGRGSVIDVARRDSA